MNPVQSYLRLWGPYADKLGIRWSVDDNVIEERDSRKVWAFAGEVADFLDGFASQRPLIHFEQTLQLLAILRKESADAAPQQERLRQLFAADGGSLRNAGAFCAQLVWGDLDAIEAESVLEITQRLRRRDVTIHWFLLDLDGSTEWSVAPTSWLVFNQAVLAELARFSDDEIRYWLKHGRGPVQSAGDAVAREVPASLVERLQRLLERPRLMGAGAFVAQLTGALALPPRRLTYQDLPLGGFTDVTTRGKIEDVLPSQFALDEDDFFRRYAEHELLFFRREDPSTQTRQELVVLLDQGVRTWGDIRLVLTAAVLALAKHAAGKKAPFLLATSTSPQVLDPARLTDDELGDYLEATELSLHPALALRSVLDQAAICPRDIVLLTHPRNLGADDLRTAVQAVPFDARLFALTLDRHGQAELSELRHGCPVPVREFHVDFTQARATPTVDQDESPRNYSTWTGDVEELGFPFGFGIHGRIPARGFDFDVTEKHLLTTCKEGLLHLWNIEGTLVEMLPRASYKGAVVRHTTHVLSVPGGFVVVGQTGADKKVWIVSHYQLSKRHCQVHPLRFKAECLEYAPRHHCLIATDGQHLGCALDLATGDRFMTDVGGGTERTRAAWADWTQGAVPRRHLRVGLQVPWNEKSHKEKCLVIDANAGDAFLIPPDPQWGRFRPLADGKPLLPTSALAEAQRGGDMLVMRLVDRRTNQLAVFRRDGTPIRTTRTGSDSLGFRLSSGGERLAHQTSVSVVQFGSVAATETRQTSLGGFSQNLRFSITNSGLYIFPGTGELFHHLRWKDGILVHDMRHVPDTGMRNLTQGLMQPLSEHLGKTFDAERWTHSAELFPLLVLRDRFGQLAVFEQHVERKLICMFITFRRRLAGWLPDGTCFGPTLMTGKPAHPDAMTRFGQALYRAVNRGLQVTTGLEDQ